ncbi:MAG: hypothetical protein PW845_14125 [Pseudomonas sp.]|nr:hypothetical protein [Pseudomonas sp.]
MFRLNQKQWLKPIVLSLPVMLPLGGVILAGSTDTFLPLVSLLYVFIWL